MESLNQATLNLFQAKEMFPSPLGEVVMESLLYFVEEQKFFVFPSPLGEVVMERKIERFLSVCRQVNSFHPR